MCWREITNQLGTAIDQVAGIDMDAMTGLEMSECLDEISRQLRRLDHTRVVCRR